MPESGKKKVVIGQRMATTRERQSEHTNKDAQEAEHEKNMDGLEVEGQTKDRCNECGYFTHRLLIYYCIIIWWYTATAIQYSPVHNI